VPTIVADPDAITRALGNLLDNAAAATLAGGLVRVTVRADDDVAAVAVFDSGRGVPAGDEERIFDRFVRVGPDASRSTSGSGLGLPIVHRIVTDYSGVIQVSSTLGVGTAVHVRLPHRAATSAEAVTAGAGVHILGAEPFSRSAAR